MRLKPGPVVNKRTPVTKSKVAGFLDFGADNLYPQTLLDLIDESDTASAAMDIRAEFIQANGLLNAEISRMVVNGQGETLDDLIGQQAWNMAFGQTICFRVGRNGLGQAISLSVAPWEQIRPAEPDDLGNIPFWGVFPFLGTGPLYRKRKAEHMKLYPYNGRQDIVLKQFTAAKRIDEVYHGQLYYKPVTRRKADLLHKPSYAEGARDMETENQISIRDFKAVTNDFGSPGAFKGLRSGKEVINEDGTKSWDDSGSLANQVEGFQGAENTNSLMIFEADTVEELDAMEFIPFVTTDLATRYTTTSQMVRERIARRTRVPNELINIRRSGGIAPTGEEIKVATALMRAWANPYQQALSRALSEIFANWYEPVAETKFAIENLNHFIAETQNATVAQPN